MNPTNEFNYIATEYLQLFRKKHKALNNPKYSDFSKSKIEEELQILEFFFNGVESIIERTNTELRNTVIKLKISNINNQKLEEFIQELVKSSIHKNDLTTFETFVKHALTSSPRL